MAFTALNDFMHVPPGGWKYTQPETETLLHGGDYYDLVEKVRRHRHLNYIDTADLETQVQTQICERLSPQARVTYCRSTTEQTTNEPTGAVSFGDVKHFLSTIKKVRRFVPQSEANRRAEICSGCPRNTAISGCTPCRNLIGLIFNVIGHRHTPLDFKLKACGVCGCELKTAVHIPLEAFPDQPRYDYPEWCWHSTSVSQSAASARRP